MKFSVYAFIFVLILSFTLFSCAGPKVERIDIAQVRQFIEETDVQFSEAFNRGDAAGVAALYTEDATLLPPYSEAVQGKQGVQEFFDTGIKMGQTDLAMTIVDVGGSGDTAYEIGRYTIKIQPEGQETMADTGKYVVVWKRQADGIWKLHLDIWNSSIPMP